MLKIRTGPPVEGEDFFGREKDLKFTWGELQNGNSLIISAPRRVGKTSLAKKLLGIAREQSWNTVELNLEEIRSEEDFIRHLINKLSETSFFKKTKRDFKEKLASIAEKIEPKISAGDVEIALSWQNRRNEVYEDLEKALEYDQNTLIFIDELTVLLSHHLKHDQEEGEEKVAFFLKWLRSVRQKSGSKIRWVFCSSVGIQNFMNLHNLSYTINDLANYELGPISEQEAEELLKLLFNSRQITASAELIEACMAKIDWYVPYFLQILVSGIDKLITVDGMEASAETLNKAYKSLTESQHFNTWDERLEEYGQLETMARKILGAISAKSGGLKRPKISALFLELQNKDDHSERNISRVLSMLQTDGYLVTTAANNYLFRSPLIRDYWFNKFVR